MNFHWDFDDADLDRVRLVVKRHEEHSLVKDRIERNLADNKQSPSREEFWYATVYAILTSNQRSGPTSRVVQFLEMQPFRLSLGCCEGCDNALGLARDELGLRGVRFGKTRIPGFVAANLQRMIGAEWNQIADEMKRLCLEQNVMGERRAARLISSPTLAGIGPKQSRNLLQMLGLTRYETPIDSRVMDWLRGVGFPLPLSSTALSDHDFYEFVEDGLQLLCAKAGVMPCVFDAAVFVSFDGE